MWIVPKSIVNHYKNPDWFATVWIKVLVCGEMSSGLMKEILNSLAIMTIMDGDKICKLKITIPTMKPGGSFAEIVVPFIKWHHDGKLCRYIEAIFYQTEI